MTDDDQRGRCCWLSGGERCHYPGAISHSTRGDGPWYCGGHFSCGGDGRKGHEIVEASRSYTLGEPRAYPQPTYEFRTPNTPPRLPYVDRDLEALVQAEPGANG